LNYNFYTLSEIQSLDFCPENVFMMDSGTTPSHLEYGTKPLNTNDSLVNKFRELIKSHMVQGLINDKLEWQRAYNFEFSKKYDIYSFNFPVHMQLDYFEIEFLGDKVTKSSIPHDYVRFALKNDCGYLINNSIGEIHKADIIMIKSVIVTQKLIDIVNS
jgi:hypothetical protein